jgi:hypothetical protein
MGTDSVHTLCCHSSATLQGTCQASPYDTAWIQLAQVCPLTRHGGPVLNLVNQVLLFLVAVGQDSVGLSLAVGLAEPGCGHIQSGSRIRETSDVVPRIRTVNITHLLWPD